MARKKKAAFSGAILAGAAVAVIAIIFSKSTGYIPTPDDVLFSETPAELDAYYEYMNELYLAKQIDEEEYIALYEAYESKYMEFSPGEGA